MKPIVCCRRQKLRLWRFASIDLLAETQAEPLAARLASKDKVAQTFSWFCGTLQLTALLYVVFIILSGLSLPIGAILNA